MHKVTALFLATLLSVPSVLFAADAPGIQPDNRSITSRSTGAGLLAKTPVREAIRLASLTDDVPLTADQKTTVERGWAGRHPVLLGMLLGTGIGAAYGAASCNDGCFPIGRGGAAVVSAPFGAGFGALAGVIVKASRK